MPPVDREESNLLLRRAGAVLFIVAAAVCVGIGAGNAWLGWGVFFSLLVLCDVPYGLTKG